MLKNTIAKLRGEATMNRETGNKAALRPSATVFRVIRTVNLVENPKRRSSGAL